MTALIWVSFALLRTGNVLSDHKEFVSEWSAPSTLPLHVLLQSDA